jgi:hypothetical protein
MAAVPLNLQPTTTKEFLIAMRDNILQYGWCQRAYYIDEKGEGFSLTGVSTKYIKGCCLIGAMQLVQADTRLQGEAFIAIRHEIDKKDLLNSPLIEWNDAPGRTKDEVVDMLNKLIGEQA